MVREIKNKIHKLNLDNRDLREYANMCSYDKAIELREIKNNNEKKIDFYKCLLEVVAKKEKSIK